MAVSRYHLPEHVSSHVDYVNPGVALSAPLEKKTVSKRWDRPHRWGLQPHGPPQPHPNHQWSHHKYGNGPSNSSALPPELQNCGKKMTPDCLRAL
jgi:tripeptidyl-peptidase I